MLGFDRGGAYPQVFAHCRDQDVHWVTYRRAPLAVPAALPVITAITYGGRTRQIAWAEETVQLKDYGEARQITLFEHGRVALQILTSDFDACPAEILSWLKSRWREENFLKYASENYGIDKICDYLASIETNTKLIRNPARDQANAAVRDAEKTLAAAERDLAGLLADPAITPAAKNGRIPALQENITRARAAAGRRRRGPQADPRETARQRHRPRRENRAAARRPPRPADGPAAPRAQRRALAIGPPQRLPARRRRIPRHHPPDHHPRPGRHHHLDPRRDHRHPRPARRPPRRPRPGTAHRGDQRHPARHARRQPPHHLPPRTPARHLTPDAQPSPEIWALREQPTAHSRLTWPDRAWLALLAGTLPAGRLAAARENESWGYRRIHGELAALGIKVAPSTVWQILKNAGIDPAPRRDGPGRAEFLRSPGAGDPGAGLLHR